MSIRIDRLLAEHEEAAALARAKALDAQMAAAAAEERAVAIRRSWDLKAQMFERAVNETNEKLRPLGLELACQSQRDTSAGDIFHSRLDDGRQGMHGGSFRVHRSGNVYTSVSSDNLSNWCDRKTSVDDLDRAFIDEFIADVLEARLRPTQNPKA